MGPKRLTILIIIVWLAVFLSVLAYFTYRASADEVYCATVFEKGAPHSHCGTVRELDQRANTVCSSWFAPYYECPTARDLANDAADQERQRARRK